MRAFLIRRAIAQERQAISPYGESLLSGPLVADGPTFGQGLHADLETPHSVFITVHNKSDQAWNDVVAELAVYDRREHYLRQEPCKFGSLAAEETRQRSFDPTAPQECLYSVGQAPAKALPRPRGYKTHGKEKQPPSGRKSLF